MFVTATLYKTGAHSLSLSNTHTHTKYISLNYIHTQTYTDKNIGTYDTHAHTRPGTSTHSNIHTGTKTHSPTKYSGTSFNIDVVRINGVQSNVVWSQLCAMLYKAVASYNGFFQHCTKQWWTRQRCTRQCLTVSYNVVNIVWGTTVYLSRFSLFLFQTLTWSCTLKHRHRHRVIRR